MRNLLFSVIAGLLGLCVFAPGSDGNSNATLYLHLYSNRYDIHSMSSELPPPPRDFQCILTLALHPEKQIFANVPNHYEPEIEICGKIKRSKDTLTGNVKFVVQDVGIAYSHEHCKPIRVGQFEPFDMDQDFRFVVTESESPPELPKTKTDKEAGNNAVNGSRR